jgi:chromate reductase
MTKFNVAVIVGSLRKESFNLKLAKALTNLGKDTIDTKFLQIDDLPLFNQDIESNFPPQATRLKNEITSADAVLFVTPEYNRSVPGPLKNAIDWASRPYGKNAFAGKPAAICGTSQGAIGTACAQHSLRPILGYLDVMLMGPPEVYLQFKDGLIDNEGTISDANTKKFLQGFIDKYIDWVEQHVGGAASTGQAKRACA